MCERDTVPSSITDGDAMIELEEESETLSYSFLGVHAQRKRERR